MCMLMLYVTEIDGAQGQWVAQLCGCKASSPLSACQKTEACQQLWVFVTFSVCTLASVYLCVSTVCESWCLCIWHGDSLVYCQQFSMSQVSSRCDTCWPWTRAGNTGDNTDGCYQLGVCVCFCVCHSCKDKSITHVQLHTANLWMFKQTSECARMHNKRRDAESRRISRLLWYRAEKREGGKR